MVDKTIGRVWRIYKVTCARERKSYVGLTNGSVENRWANHIWSVNGKRKNGLLHWAIKRCGADAFILETLGIFNSLEEASAAEQRFIAAHGTLSPKGYNITEGGMGTPGFRKPHSEETKRKIGIAHKGRAASATARANMSAAKKGKPFPRAAVETSAAKRRGIPLNAALKEKIRNAHLGRPRPLRSLAFLLKSLAAIEAGATKNIRLEHGRWSTRINIGGQRRKHLGTFNTYSEALAAYRSAVVARIEEIRSAHLSI
jgi:group I intron endonuclease